MIRIDVFTEGVEIESGPVTEEFIRGTAMSAAVRAGCENAVITMILTDNAVIREINRDYRGIDSPTDVISFSNRDNPFPAPDGEAEDLGDVYISLERAAEQAPEYGHSEKDEIKRLIVHGILHLLGYDHETSEEDARVMEDLEDDILSGI